MALLSGFKQIRVGSAKESSVEYRTAQRDKWGNKLFIPILIIPIVTFAVAQFTKLGALMGLGWHL